jgi:HSP20 family protein
MPTPKPSTGLMTLRQEVDRLFDRFFEPWRGQEEARAIGEWAPNLDVSETKDALIVKADVPGMEAKDIQVSLQEQMLTIKGEKKQEKEEKDENFHRVERSYGAFMRAVRLPVPVDAGKVAASFKNGVLTITLPKTPGGKGTAIPVSTA